MPLVETWSWLVVAPAQASAPGPEANPAVDNRPQYWCELAKNGDMWLLAKEGHLIAWQCMGRGCHH